MNSADAVILRAEAATLGAILLEPQALSTVSWLRGGDFADPWHARVHDQLRQHALSEIDALRLGEWLSAAFPPQQADLPRIATLLEVVPLRPGVNAYARMVLEASIRRDQPAYGVLLRGGALQAALTGTAQPMCAAAAFTERGITAAETRWTQANMPPGARPRSGVPELVGGGARVRDVLVGADRYLTAHGDIDPADVRAREQDLIATLITHRHAVPGVAAWLNPGMVTDRAWRAAYRAICDLDAGGEWVDEVTVLWRTGQLVRANGPGPDPRELLASAEFAAAQDPSWCTRAVAGDQLRALAARASTALVANAANPGLTVADLLDSARAHTAALVDLAQAALPLQDTPELGEQLLPLASHRTLDRSAFAGWVG